MNVTDRLPPAWCPPDGWMIYLNVLAAQIQWTLSFPDVLNTYPQPTYLLNGLEKNQYFHREIPSFYISAL